MPLSNHQYTFFNYLFESEYYSKSTHLEIGVFKGDGISELAKKFKDKNFICIDPFIEDGNTCDHSGFKREEKMTSIKEECLNNFKDLNNIKLYELESLHFFNQIRSKEIIDKNLNNITSVNIDGAHDASSLLTDIELSIYLLKGKIGVIHFDDCLNIHDVTKTILEKFICEYYKNIINITKTGPDSIAFNIDLTNG